MHLQIFHAKTFVLEGEEGGGEGVSFEVWSQTIMYEFRTC